MSMVLQSRNLLDDDESPEDLSEIAVSQIAGALFPIVKVTGGEEESFVDIETLTEVESKFLILRGTAAPGDNLLTAGRRTFYFRLDTDGDVIELHVSFDGLSWKEVTIGSGDDAGDTIAQGVGITITEATDGTKTIAVSRPFTSDDESKLDAIEAEATKNQAGTGTTIGDDGEVNIDNPFTSQDESKLDGITAQATRNAAGDGLDESGGTFSINDAYVENLIGAADVYVEHFRLGYVSSFFTTQEARWGANATTIYMQPTVSNRPVVAALVDGEKIQVRNVDGSTRNTFTLNADVIGPDNAGVFTLNGGDGAWDENPIFVNGTNYGLYFSLNRPHGIPDDVTLELTDDNEIRIKAGGVRETHIADDMLNAAQAIFRDRLGIPPLGGHAPILLAPAQVGHTSDAITLQPSSVPDNYDGGLSYRFRTKRSNNGAVTLRLGTLSFVPLRQLDGTDFEAGELPSGYYVNVVYDSVNNQFVVLNVQLDGEGIPAGGEDGQILGKLGPEDFNAGWIDPSTDSGGASSFSELSDTPDAIVRDRYVKSSVSSDELEYVESAPAAAQRSESVTFQAGGEEIENDGVIISPATSNAIGVTFPQTGGGNPQMLDAGSNADGFVVLQRGIYYITVRGSVVAVTARCTAQFRIYEYDADITTALPIGRTQNTYIRYQHTNAQPIFEDGILEVTEDNTAVKIVAISALPDAGQPGTDNSRWTLNAGMILKLYRVGIKGEPGAGVLSEISLANILDDASSTVGGITGRRAKALIDHYVSDVDTYHLTVDRNYVTGTPNAANDITITLHSGTVYNIGISHYTGAEALPDNYLRGLPVGTEIRLVDGDIVWVGELISVHDVTGTSATLRVNFDDRTGLLTDFTVNDNVEISFGYSPARIPFASEIDVAGDLDGNLSESEPDLESIIQSIDNFDLGGDGDFVTAGTAIEITDDDPRVINNTKPFTDAESDILGELASSARHTLDDDLVLRLQYGAEHFFDGRSPVITGLAIIDGHIYVGSDDGFVNDQRGVNEEGIYDLTTNNNDPATAGNWYFADGGHIRIRERSASGLWTNASPSQNSTGIPVTSGIGISVDPENLTVMFFLHMRSDGVRIEGLLVSTFPSSGAITYQSEHDITRASINTVLTANNLGTLSVIRNTIGNVGVTAMGALNNVVYFVVSGVVNNENGIPVSAILRITTSGSGASRTFALDTEYCKIVGIRNGVQGIVPTEEGFWLSTEHIVYEYHHSTGVGGGGFSSVALGDADLEPSTENEWIATGIQIPEADDTDYLLINFGRDIVAGNPAQRRGGEKLVSVSKLRALAAGTVGGTPTFTGSLNFEDDLSNNVLKLGRLASNELLYASLGPEPAVDFEVRRVLKAEESGLSTVAVNEDFFEGDGSEAEPINLKASIGTTDRTTFRTRIDAQQNIPMAVYYLAGQTIRNPTTLRAFPTGSSAHLHNACLSFTDVQETIYGGDTAIVPHILWADIDVVSSADWNGQGESRSSFTMSSGTYSFAMHVEGGGVSDANQTLQMLIATSGTDDVVIANRPGLDGIR